MQEIWMLHISFYGHCRTLTGIARKFGKQIQRRQLDLPEYSASFTNYKALKKVPSCFVVWFQRCITSSALVNPLSQLIKQLSAPRQSAQCQQQLQSLSINNTLPAGTAKSSASGCFDHQSCFRANKDVFFFRLVRRASTYVVVIRLICWWHAIRNERLRKSMCSIFKRRQRYDLPLLYPGPRCIRWQSVIVLTTSQNTTW